MNEASERETFNDLEGRTLHHIRVAGSLIRKLLVARDAANLELLAYHVAQLRTLRHELGNCYTIRVQS